MPKILITLADDDNKEFRKDIELEVDGTDYLVLKDQAKHCNWDFYSRAWDGMCDKICAQYGLPKNWYIYHIRFSC